MDAKLHTVEGYVNTRPKDGRCTRLTQALTSLPLRHFFHIVERLHRIPQY
jgi:hypothetical protein